MVQRVCVCADLRPAAGGQTQRNLMNQAAWCSGRHQMELAFMSQSSFFVSRRHFSATRCSAPAAQLGQKHRVWMRMRSALEAVSDAENNLADAGTGKEGHMGADLS